MNGSKYFVYGERWRELDVQTGAVAGWGRRPRFVYVRRGRLRVASRRRVLAALQAFAANEPSAAGFGVRLSAYSRDHGEHRSKRKGLPSVPAVCDHQHYNVQHYCCAPYKGCNNNNIHCPGGAHCAAGTGVGAQQRVTVDAAVQHLPPDNHTLTISLTNLPPPAPPVAPAAARQRSPPPCAAPAGDRPASVKRARLSDSDTDQIFRKRRKVADSPSREKKAVKSKTKRKKREETVEEDEESSGEMCKELMIPESDVRALRSYVARTRRGALARFDADDEYKLALFYAINPLVYVARCALTERAIRERLPLALKPFAARLGLTPSPRLRATARSDSEAETFQNTSQNKRRSLRTRGVFQETSRPIPTSVRRTPGHRDVDSNRKPAPPAVDSSDSDYSVDVKLSTKTIDKRKAETTDDSDIDYQTQIDKTNMERIRRGSIRRRRKSQSTVSDDSSYSDAEPSSTRRVSLRTRVAIEKISIKDSDSDSESTQEVEHKRNVLRSSTGAQSPLNSPHSRAAATAERTEKQIIESKRNALRANTDVHAKVESRNSDSDRRTEHKREVTRKKNKTQDSDSETRANINNIRDPLRNKNGIQIKTDARDTNSDSDVKAKNKHSAPPLRSKAEPQKKAAQVSDSDIEEDTSRKRDALRNNTKLQRQDDTQDSDSGSEFKTSHKRNSLRNNVKADARDGRARTNIDHRRKPTVSHAETNKQKSDRESSPVHNRRIALRRSTLTQSKPNRQNSDSDYETQKYKQINNNKTKSPRQETASEAEPRKQYSDDDKREDVDRLSENKRDLLRKKAATTTSVDRQSNRKPVSERDKTSKVKVRQQAATVAIRSDSEVKSMRSEAASAAPARAKRPAAESSAGKQSQTHVISKRASASGSKEYSNLEDHAIVAWVLTGGRARLVNGNRLWRELFDHYERLTGVRRSWHSLRNRYLRYILPGLGALHLPPADVSRLRAAAATGEMKAKRSGLPAARRNSIFHRSAVHSAAARRPGPAAPNDGASSGEGGRAAGAAARDRGAERRSRRSLRADSPAPASAPALAPAPATSKSPRTRKLFNPKLVL